MSDDGSQAPPPPPEPKLFKILCCPVDTKKGHSIVKSLEKPYKDNEDDKNIILGKIQINEGSMAGNDKLFVPKGVRKVVDVTLYHLYRL